MPIEDVTSLLTAHPHRLAAVTEGVPASRLATPPSPTEWSPLEILAHLRACADVWGEAIATILAEDAPTIRAIDPRTWMTRTDYPSLDFHDSLHAFSDQRAALVTTLAALPLDDWQRTATVRGAGAPIVRTLHSFADRLARHERSHIRQIERTVSSLT
jgi:hypothetical protein